MSVIKRRGWATLLLGGVWAGCASSLHPLPQIEPRGVVVDAGAVAAALSEADEAWTERTLDSVRRSAEVGLGLVAEGGRRIEGSIVATRAMVWLAGHEPTAPSRRDAASAAVRVGQICRERVPLAAECAYWLGVALGVQARERRATALDALPRMVALLEEAAAGRPDLDEAGPHRVLSLVLLRAPGWPTGPGDPERALELATRATEIAPGWAPNWLALGEAHEAHRDRRAAEAAYRTALERAAEAGRRGTPEAGEWVDEARSRLLSLGPVPS